MAKRIFVAGHRGLVGSALVRQIQKKNLGEPVLRTRQELDLLRADDVMQFFKSEKPDWVFLAAAKVGGIHGNNTYPYEFIYENLQIQNNVINAARTVGVEKFLFLGSSCIYPKLAPQPMQEEHLLSGKLEPTNEPYALAKIAGIKMCAALRREYGLNFYSVMPSNLFGPGDNYHPQNAHVIPMLLRRFHEARERGDRQVTVWGTGTPKREFLFSDDLAEACVFLMEKYNASDIGDFVNVGTGTDVTIRELAEEIKKVTGFQGELVFDTTKPDGTPRKLLDVSRMRELGWTSKTTLSQGLQVAYRDFVEKGLQNQKDGK